MTTIVVTGATGSFGSAFISHLLKKTNYNILGISRNETTQEDLAAELNSDRVEFIPCDIRHTDSLKDIFSRLHADWVVHAAALKRVPSSYKYAQEYADININGTISLLRAISDTGISRILYISSDKAVNAYNPYGATKRVAEALMLEANKLDSIWWLKDELAYKVDNGGIAPAFATAVVRGGNVWNSNGSVMRLWRRQADVGKAITLTDPKATRFHLPMDYWCKYVLYVLRSMMPGNIYVPRLRAYNMAELAHAFLATANKKGSHIKIVGPRRGDKQHEWLISSNEAQYAVEWADGYVVRPKPMAGHLPAGICSANAEMLTAEELRELANGAI